MRLSETDLTTIRLIIRSVLGDDAKVWLFGSRVDDTARGGDVDLYVETSCQPSLTDRLQLKESLIDATERSVDLVINDLRHTLPIFEIARKTGVRLH